MSLKKYDLLPCPVVKVAPLVKRYQRPNGPQSSEVWCFMTVHLKKLSVGSASVDGLRALQAQRLATENPQEPLAQPAIDHVALKNGFGQQLSEELEVLQKSTT